MSDCRCKQPCSPCSNNCPDDKITVITSTIDSWDIASVSILAPEDCNTNCCWKSCSDNCWINIQSTNDCLVVDTSECGVIKLTAECPKPTYVKAGDNVTVRDVVPPDDCYIDWWDCWVDGWWEVSALDEKVKACSGDTTPGYLNQKLQEWYWINIDEVGCDGDTNSKLRISIDESALPVCPSIPDIEIIDNSNLINATANGHRITITDADMKAYYAKLVLKENHIISFPTGTLDAWVEKYLWALTPVEWMPTRESWWQLEARNSLRKNLEFFQGTDDDPWYWWIRITKKWLYQVGFSWSAEFSYWVHAFRVQLYKIPQGNFNKRNTIVESRYSWPLGYEPRQPVMWWAWNIRYVSSVSWWSWESAPSVSYSEYHIDYPLIGEKTEVEWQHGIWYSASLWAVMDRVTATGNTIVELDYWDVLCIWLKVNTTITHSWSMMANIPAAFLTGHFALLGIDQGESDNWWEAWFSFYANLIHPILT